MARRSKAGEGIGEFIKTVFWAGLIAVTIHTFLYEPFYIPSGSMVPTLLVGDYLFINKFAYGYSRYSFPVPVPGMQGRLFGHAIQRGDVVVFVPPGAMDEDFIKRVIGLPGDSVQVSDGQLLINNQPVPAQDAGAYTDDSSGYPTLGRAYTETLPGDRVHQTLRFPDAEQGADPATYYANNTPVFHVPAGDVFMMGDSRDNSEDSRFPDGPVGFVPEQNVLGPAQLIFFSVDMQHPFWAVWDWPLEIRWGRLLRGIA